jgi:hypothetical protein
MPDRHNALAVIAFHGVIGGTRVEGTKCLWTKGYDAERGKRECAALRRERTWVLDFAGRISACKGRSESGTRLVAAIGIEYRFGDARGAQAIVKKPMARLRGLLLIPCPRFFTHESKNLRRG